MEPTGHFFCGGGVNGLIVVVERYIKNKKWYVKIPSGIKWLLTTLAVYFLWILFMSPDIETAFATYAGMFTVSQETVNFTWEYYLTKKIVILLIVASVGAVMGAVTMPEKADELKLSLAGMILQKIVYLILFIVSVLFVVNSSYSPFLYFQF